MNGEDVRPWAKGLRHLVLWHLARSGPASARDLAALASQPPANIAPRLSELAAAGQVECFGLVRSGGRGRPEKVWRLPAPKPVEQTALSLT